MKKSNEYSLKVAQQQAFFEVFNLHAKNGKITRGDLLDIFDRVGYNVSTENFNNICERTFGEKEKITFEQFI